MTHATTRYFTMVLALGFSLLTLAGRFAEAASMNPYVDTVLGQNPMAYWRLNEQSGGTATDETTNGNDGTYTVSPTLGAAGPQYPAFPGFGFGNNFAPAFDGSTDQRMNATLTGLSLSYSITGWIRNLRDTDVAAITGYAFARSDSTGVGEQLTSDHVGINGTNASTGSEGDLFLHNGSAAVNGVTQVLDNDWHHIALTRSGTAVTLYLDGDVEVSGTLAATITNTTGIISVGTRSDFNFDWLGELDEIAVFNRVLNSTEIEAQFDAAFETPVVPEPSSGLLIMLGAAGMVARRRTRRSRERQMSGRPEQAVRRRRASKKCVPTRKVGTRQGT